MNLKHLLTQSFNIDTWKGILNKILGSNIQYFTTPQAINHKTIIKGEHIASVRLDDGKTLGIIDIEVDQHTIIARNRKALRGIVADYIDQQKIHGLLVFFHAKGQKDYRLSYIVKQTYFTPEGEFIKHESEPKRYTFLLGENESCTTASIRLSELIKKRSEGSLYMLDLTEAFSVEKLNKEFFKKYVEHYTCFCKDIISNETCRVGQFRIQDKEDFKHDVNKPIRDYVKKMMGRLVFLQFLQKKGWMNGDYAYLQNLYTAKTEFHADYLEKVLEPLFFNVLNTKEEKRDTEKIVNLGDVSGIPYLNGGLFEKDKLDSKVVIFTPSLFKDLFEFFSHYNFTIDENDPYDAEVGIDPEMLGHIFENLLEDNKDKGAFYTPKEIVQYMCRQSLIEYLKSKTAEQHSDWETHITKLINTHKLSEEMQDNKIFLADIQQHLKEVKICDPAIGSGAFPMGILYELFYCRQILYGHSLEKQSFTPAEIKREIIQNSIYGVDIEQGAVDIARLRFWLSLVVDEVEPQPLPNLDYKIVCGNSLITTFGGKFIDLNRKKGKNSEKIKNKKKELFKLQNDFYSLNGEDKYAKEADIKRHIIDIIQLQLDYQLDSSAASIDTQANLFEEQKGLKAQKVSPDLGEQLIVLRSINTRLNNPERTTEEIAKTNIPFFDWEIMFPDIFIDETPSKRGFDIVIGNPPYLRIQGIRDVDSDLADNYVDKFDSATGSFDLYALFVEQGLRSIATDGIVNYIMPVKWTNAAFGKGLRKVIEKNQSAHKIIAFGAYQVFNASTYTGLQWFKNDSENLQYCELDKNLYTNEELGRYLSSLNNDSYANIPANKLSDKAWVLTVGETTKILNLLEQQPRRISDIFEKIFQGLATSKDDVYFLYGCTDQETTVIGFSKHLDRFVEIERGMVKPLLKGEDVHRYDNILADKYVIFPYKFEEGKANLYSEPELSELFPMGYEYLKECEDVLRGREKGRFNIDGEWFQFGRKQGILFAEFEKLVAPDISMGGNFAYDVKGEFYSTTTIYGYIKRKEVTDNYKVLMAILNSRLCWWFLTKTGTTLANGFFRFKPDYINPFPVPSIEAVEQVSEIVEHLVDYMEYLYNSQNEDIISHTSNKRISTHIEDILNMVIYELYFGEHMKEVGIDVIADLSKYNFTNNVDASTIEEFYLWYQTSENLIRQKLMLLDTRSRNLIYEINLSKVYEQDK